MAIKRKPKDLKSAVFCRVCKKKLPKSVLMNSTTDICYFCFRKQKFGY